MDRVRRVERSWTGVLAAAAAEHDVAQPFRAAGGRWQAWVFSHAHGCRAAVGRPAASAPEAVRRAPEARWIPSERRREGLRYGVFSWLAVGETPASACWTNTSCGSAPRISTVSLTTVFGTPVT